MGTTPRRIRPAAGSISSVRAEIRLDITGNAACDTGEVLPREGALIMDSKSKPGWGSWLILGVLIGLLCLAIVVLYVSWNPEHSGAMTGAGYVAMTLGVVATLALGVGLMALMYYSNRSGRD
jgi:hypothetical protein